MIIFDFDNTLFNTPLLKDDIRHVFEKYEIRGQEFWKSFYKSYDIRSESAGYNIDQHLSLLKDLTKKQKGSIKQDIESVMWDRGQQYIYSDALPILNKLKELGVEMILLCRGDKEFKKFKFEVTGIADYFDQIFVEDNIVPVLNKIVRKTKKDQKDILFINHKIEDLRAVKAKFPDIFCIFINRNQQVEPKDLSMPSVATLNELSWYLRTLQFK